MVVINKCSFYNFVKVDTANDNSQERNTPVIDHSIPPPPLLGYVLPAPMAERSETWSCPLADDCSSIIVPWETGIESWSGQ